MLHECNHLTTNFVWFSLQVGSSWVSNLGRLIKGSCISLLLTRILSVIECFFQKSMLQVWLCKLVSRFAICVGQCNNPPKHFLLFLDSNSDIALVYCLLSFFSICFNIFQNWSYCFCRLCFRKKCCRSLKKRLFLRNSKTCWIADIKQYGICSSKMLFLPVKE